MNRSERQPRSGEQGSALVLTILVMVIMTLLGISFLMMAETENRIAENERLGAQALYFGEAGARQVKRWIDHPGAATNLINPPLAVIDRTLRLIDADGDPNTAAVAADGTVAKPYYKQGVDLDIDGIDDVFDRPYRGDLLDALLGTEAGPDMRIDENASAAAKTFLTNMSTALMAGYPTGNAGGIQARISRIDVYAPPYVNVAGTWTRYGMATIKVIARIYKDQGGVELVLAERRIKAVLNEMPFPGAFGPLQSCSNMSLKGNFAAHWGIQTAVSSTDMVNNHNQVTASIPRVIPPSARIDLLWGYNNDADFAAYKTAIDGLVVEDPWSRHASGGAIVGAPNTDSQPYPFTWVAGNPLGDGDFPNHPGGPNDATHSNLFQNMPIVTCPDFNYEFWKELATSGEDAVHYYVWDSGTSFRENGVGAAQTFRAITDNQEGLFFFDTRDGLPPRDDNGDGVYDNLTPQIKISGGTWGVRGFIYLNSDDFQTKGITGRAVTFNAPGEPFQDKDQDGEFDPGDGEDWINLDYPTAGPAFPFVADAADTYGGAVMRNDKGPDIAGTAVLWGILFNNGYFDATGNATYYGSVVSKQGIGETEPAAGTPDLYWDESIVTDKWPPNDWDLPRVVVTRWETEG